MKPLKLGLYGCGARTNALVDSISGDNLVKVVCCYDTDEKRRSEAARKYNAVAVDSSEKLVASTEVEAFIISLPPKFHARAAVETAEAGKPVFLEKPIATTLEDAKRVAKAIRDAGIICRVGLAHRYVPVFKKVTEIIRSGALGKIIGIHNHWLGWAAAIPKLINESEQKDWRGDPETGGQLVYHYCHFFDLLRVWGGEFVSVMAMTNHLIFPKSPTENEIFMSLEYESGALAGLQFSEVSRRSDMIGRIEGTEITLEYECNDNSVIGIYRETKRRGPRIPDEVMEGFDTAASDREDIMVPFVREARGEQPVQVTVEDGLITLEVATAVRLSAETGKQIYLKELK